MGTRFFGTRYIRDGQMGTESQNSVLFCYQLGGLKALLVRHEKPDFIHGLERNLFTFLQNPPYVNEFEIYPRDRFLRHNP